MTHTFLISHLDFILSLFMWMFKTMDSSYQQPPQGQTPPINTPCQQSNLQCSRYFSIQYHTQYRDWWMLISQWIRFGRSLSICIETMCMIRRIILLILGGSLCWISAFYLLFNFFKRLRWGFGRGVSGWVTACLFYWCFWCFF